MTLAELKKGNHYKTTSGAIFEFIEFDRDGDIVMKEIRNYMKIQSGITTFFKWYAEDLEEVEKLPA